MTARFSGRAYKGAMRDHRALLREEAEKRNLAYREAHPDLAPKKDKKPAKPGPKTRRGRRRAQEPAETLVVAPAPVPTPAVMPESLPSSYTGVVTAADLESLRAALNTRS